MSQMHCPHKDQLSSFALGTLDESSAVKISEHVEHCPQCDATLSNLDGAADTVMLQLRQVALVEPYSEEEELQRGLAAARAIGELPSTPASELLNQPAELSKSLPQLGEYRFLTKLGEGGMGSVYQAVHIRLGKIVAIKVLSVSQGANPVAINRFSREMKAIGGLDHPHLIRAYDAGEIDNQHYLVMEYIDGVDLAVLGKTVGQLAIADACDVIRQAALGLEYAHQRGLVHRDIKPSNLMLTAAGQVKVLDLGLALLGPAEDADLALTSSGQIMGTVEFMAPEQGGDTHRVDIRADIYSLGATLYKLLTGHSPHANPKHTTTMQKLTALATQQPVPIRLRRTDIPQSLAKIIQQMLAKDPNQRISTPSDVVQALQPFVAGANLPVLVAQCRSSQQTIAITPEMTDDLTVLTVDSISASPILCPANIKEHLGTDNSSRWRTIIRWTVASGTSFLVVLAAVIFFWQTPHGTVRIEINDPAIKIAFDHQGPEITQADQKPVRLRTGPHQLTVRVGDLEYDTQQFVLKNKTEEISLKVELLPGKVLVSLDNTELDSHPIRKAAPSRQPEHPTQVAVAAISETNNFTEPGKFSGAVDLDRPFVLIRSGKKFSEFKTAAGALAELQAGDELEVHGNGPFALPLINFDGKSLVLRAAPGFRPRFVPSKTAAEEATKIPSSPWLYVKNAALTLDGCEFDFLPGAAFMAVGDGGPWRITHCRLYQPDAVNRGLIYYAGPKLHISDSLLISGFSYGSIDFGEDAELEFENNVFWSSAYVRFQLASKGKPKLSLTGNTFDGITGCFGLPADTEPSIRSNNNIYIFNRGGILAGSQRLNTEEAKAQMEWNGNFNLYVLGLPSHLTASFLNYAKDFKSIPLISGNLSDWQKLWGDHEQHALAASGPTLLHHAAWLPDKSDDPLPRLQHWTNRRLEHEFPTVKTAAKPELKDPTNVPSNAATSLVLPVHSRDVGPDWSIVGTGQGYLRARAAAGHPVGKDQLLPEAGDDGAFTLIRTGQPDRSYPSLLSAVDAAADGDSVAIHTGGMVAGIDRSNVKPGKRLTLRAGYGHRPSVTSLTLGSEDVWSLEGLHFTMDVNVVSAKPIVPGTSDFQVPRLINCSFAAAPDWQTCVGPSLRLVANPEEGATCDVINCVLPNYISSMSRRINIVNSAICGIDYGNVDTTWTRQLDLDRCVVYSGASYSIMSGPAAMSVSASRSWFEFGILRHGGENVPFAWEGDHNVFCHGPSRWMDAYQKPDRIWDLNAWQARWNSDANSRSGDAAYVDPRFYKVLPESPAHAAAENKRDLGADVSRFVNPIEVRSP
jgi:serine/threonine protein kinase